MTQNLLFAIKREGPDKGLKLSRRASFKSGKEGRQPAQRKPAVFEKRHSSGFPKEKRA